jgi:hypothetical protein
VFQGDQSISRQNKKTCTSGFTYRHRFCFSSTLGIVRRCDSRRALEVREDIFPCITLVADFICPPLEGAFRWTTRRRFSSSVSSCKGVVGVLPNVGLVVPRRTATQSLPSRISEDFVVKSLNETLDHPQRQRTGALQLAASLRNPNQAAGSEAAVTSPKSALRRDQR